MKKKYDFYVIYKKGYLTKQEEYTKDISCNTLFFETKEEAKENCEIDKSIKKVTFVIDNIEDVK